MRDNLVSLSSGLKEWIIITLKESLAVKGFICRKMFLLFPTELSKSAGVS